MLNQRYCWGLIASLMANLIAGTHCQAQSISLVGRASLSPTATDLSGETALQEDGTPQNQLGGLGSGIAWLGTGDRYVMIPDRGPGDGATSYRCRFQVVEIPVDPAASEPVKVRLVGTHFLTNDKGVNYVGRSTQFNPSQPSNSLRMDPEGIRATKSGSYFIADEYGPSVRHFDGSGKLIQVLPTPKKYEIQFPSGSPEQELPPRNLSGRQANRGWEGLALSGDDRKLFAILQSPLIQDGGLNAQNKRVGTNVRIWEHDLVTSKSREFLYQLEDKSHGCSEIEWVSPNRLLVIERDGKPGSEAKAKRVYDIDLTHATDISSLEKLPSTGIPAGVQPVAKRLFLDLLAPELGLAGDQFPEKIEGIALGPVLPDGRRVVVIASDNDFKKDEPTEFYVFATKLD
ncbi:MULTISPECIES: esterase-like activity of phytase family protein [unclassified Schlesneria]|uniref:esterase-like activity of phytase family protein n=1 Tax=unclassified Schlesneria TaxID=2762017 RepID=UPI002EDD7BAC